MADVRALLREERVSRRINHPQATYSSAGTLICLTCHMSIKAESLWEKHLRSPHHTTQLQRNRDETHDRKPGATSRSDETISARNPNQSSKKRKADVDEEPTGKTKKAKAVDGIPGSFLNEGTTHADGVEPEFEQQEQKSTVAGPDINPQEPSLGQSNPLPTSSQPSLISPSPPHTSTHTTSLPTRTSTISAPIASIDEDEWAAFERDIATPPAPTVGTASALLASAGTITAAPLSAAEIAAQAREEAEMQQTKTEEAEAEAEKEDAERRLEDEFEEMAGLEERVRILKEKREALRKGGGGGATGKTDQVNPVTRKDREGGEGEEGEDGKEGRRPAIEAQDEGKKAIDDDGAGGDSSSDDYEDDDWDNWGR